MSGSNNRRIYELWMTIKDIVGRASLWPVSIRRYFWTQNLKLWQRTLVAAFVFINGLNPQIFMEWVEVLHLASDSAAFDIFNIFFLLLNPIQDDIICMVTTFPTTDT